MRVGLEQGVKLDHSAPLTFTHPSERQLAYEISKFPDVILGKRRELVCAAMQQLNHIIPLHFD